MSVDFQRITNSRFAVGLALSIGRGVPARVGFPLTRFVARRIAGRRNSSMVRSVRANQWVVSQERLSAGELDQAVEETFSHTARCLYNLYRYLEDEEALKRMVSFDSRAEALLEQTNLGQDPIIIVGVHMSNFDFVMRAAAACGMRVLALAMPQSKDTTGYEWQNDLRRKAGVEVVPASMTALRLATGRLREGGSVLTGMDRPLPSSKYRPKFFGRPASLPVMHIHLALKTGAPVVAVAAVMQSDGVLQLLASDPIHMKSHPDRHTEIVLNAENVLNVAEEFIRLAPRQWAMFYPVWPEALAQMP